jgi:hypothetical protein
MAAYALQLAEDVVKSAKAESKLIDTAINKKMMMKKTKSHRVIDPRGGRRSPGVGGDPSGVGSGMRMMMMLDYYHLIILGK